MESLHYSFEPELSVDEFIGLLEKSTLAERRPVADKARIGEMLRNADLIVCARDGDALVGVARAITDWSFCTYLSDLAVDPAYQGRGIGRELIAQTHRRAGRRTTLILLAAPQAESYYPHIGMSQHGSCWLIERAE